jgi:ribonuclease HI
VSRLQAFFEQGPTPRKAPNYTTSGINHTSDNATATILALTRTEINRMRKRELKEQLKLRNLNTSGTKKVLIPRLLDAIEVDEIVRELPIMNNSENQSEIKSSASPPSREDQKFAAALEVVDPTGGCVDSENKSEENVSANRPLQQDQQLAEVLEVVDPTGNYILRVKGVSCLQSYGTGIGIVLVNANDDRDVCTARKVLQGNRSVFEAGYSALIVGIRFALNRGVRNLTLQIDHDVIVSQLTGKFQVNRENLKPMYWNIMHHKEESFDTFTVEHISLEMNTEATDLAARGLATGKSINIVDVFDPMGDLGTETQTKDFLKASPADAIETGNSGEITKIDPLRTYDMHFDGGARGNPGCAGVGMVLYAGNSEIWCGWKYLDQMSNNAAEYNGLLTGLECALSLGIRRIRVQGDSELIVKQIKGIYQVKNANLQILCTKAKDLIEQFDHFEISHFRREHNKRADWLANHAMDTASSYGYEEMDNMTL